MMIEGLETSGVLMVVGFWTDSRRSVFKGTASSVRLAIVTTLRSQDVTLPQAGEWRRPQDNGEATSYTWTPQSQQSSN